MPTSFERAKTVIDALMPVAAGLVKTGTVEDMVKTRLASLSQAYGGRLLNGNRQPVDYSKMTTHIAYTYRCLGAHADWVFKALSLDGGAVRARLSAKTAKIAAIGGGPGSDIAGILKFAILRNLTKAKYEFVVLDREEAWERCRSELTATFLNELDISQSYQSLDLALGEPWTSDWKFLDSDIFTFSFSLSEVWSFNQEGSVSQFLDRVISKSKKGALFCYIDNGGNNFTPLIDNELGSRADLELLGSDDDERMLLSYGEQCDVLENVYRTKFGQRPKLTGNVAMRLWKKL